MRIKYDSDLQRGKSSDDKPKMVGLYRKIGHKSVMSIHYFFMDIYDLAHLLDQAIPDMKRFGESSSKGVNWMDQFFALDLSINGANTL